jgi:osmotically-inducible protein OsmY
MNKTIMCIPLLLAFAACNKSETSAAPKGTTTNTTSSSEDLALAQRVRQGLSDDAALSSIAANVTVTAQGGTVTINGTAASASDKQTIEDKVRAMPGVTSVVDRITVK